MHTTDSRSDSAGSSLPEPTGGDPDDDRIPEGEIFEVLSNRRRRFALHYLMQHPNEAVDMSDLSTQVAAWELDTEPRALSYDDRKRVHTSLYQYHAPKLDEAGFAEYDSGRGVVELTDTAREMDLYLESIRGREIPWASYFVLLSTLAVVVTFAVRVGVWPFDALGATWVAGGVAAVFLVSSVVFAYATYTGMRLGTDGRPPSCDD